MTPRKQSVSEEPFLNTVARTLGHAAGTLSNVAHGLTENLSALPKAASSRVRTAAVTVAGSVDRHQQTKKSKKRRSRATRPRKAKAAKKAVVARTRKSVANRAPRRAKAINIRKKK